MSNDDSTIIKLLQSGPRVRELIGVILTANPSAAECERLRDLVSGQPGTSNDTKPLLKLEEARRLLNVSRSSFYRLVTSGAIKPVCLRPGIKRIRSEEIAALQRPH